MVPGSSEQTINNANKSTDEAEAGYISDDAANNVQNSAT